MYDKKLNNLLKKYNLYIDKNNLISDLISQLDINKNYLIWGGGEHSEHLLKLKEMQKINVVGIIDNDPDKIGLKIDGIEIYDRNKIKTLEFDSVIISSFDARKSIKKDIDKIFNKNKIFNKDIIQLYEDKDITPFYEFSYKNIQYLLLQSKNRNILTLLIKEYLLIRDFVNALIFIDFYINKKFYLYKNMISFKKQLLEYLEELKKKLLNTNNKNINFLIIDSLSCRSLDYMPYLSKLRNKSLFFNNAYSSSTYTTESHKSILTGYSLFENENIKKNKIDIKDSLLFKLLKRYDYSFYSYDFHRIINEEIFNMIGDKHYLPISMQLWRWICNDIESNEDKFNYLRFMETHRPYASGNIVSEKCNNKDKLYNACMYVDQQIEFYLQLYNLDKKNDCTLIFSDHGNGYTEQVSSIEDSIIPEEITHIDRIKIPLIVNGIHKSYRTVYTKIFSLKSMVDIIELYLKVASIEELDSGEQIVVERGKIYNRFLIEHYINENKKDYLDGFRTIVSNNGDRYTYCLTGKEYYYINDRSKVNNIENIEFIERIEGFRKLNERMGFPKELIS